MTRRNLPAYVWIHRALSSKAHLCRVAPKPGNGDPNSLAFKLPVPNSITRRWLEEEPRIRTTVMHASRWFTFELSSDSDLRDALEWLNRAYERAA